MVEIIFVIGPASCGKTTLIKSMFGDPSEEISPTTIEINKVWKDKQGKFIVEIGGETTDTTLSAIQAEPAKKQEYVEEYWTKTLKTIRSRLEQQKEMQKDEKIRVTGIIYMIDPSEENNDKNRGRVDTYFEFIEDSKKILVGLRESGEIEMTYEHDEISYVIFNKLDRFIKSIREGKHNDLYEYVMGKVRERGETFIITSALAIKGIMKELSGTFANNEEAEAVRMIQEAKEEEPKTLIYNSYIELVALFAAYFAELPVKGDHGQIILSGLRKVVREYFEEIQIVFNEGYIEIENTGEFIRKIEESLEELKSKDPAELYKKTIENIHNVEEALKPILQMDITNRVIEKIQERHGELKPEEIEILREEIPKALRAKQQNRRLGVAKRRLNKYKTSKEVKDSLTELFHETKGEADRLIGERIRKALIAHHEVHVGRK